MCTSWLCVRSLEPRSGLGRTVEVQGKILPSCRWGRRGEVTWERTQLIGVVTQRQRRSWPCQVPRPLQTLFLWIMLLLQQP